MPKRGQGSGRTLGLHVAVCAAVLSRSLSLSALSADTETLNWVGVRTPPVSNPLYQVPTERDLADWLVSRADGAQDNTQSARFSILQAASQSPSTPNCLPPSTQNSTYLSED